MGKEADLPPEDLETTYPVDRFAEEATSLPSSEEIGLFDLRNALSDRFHQILDEGALVGARRAGSKWALLIGGAAVIGASAYVVYRNRDGITKFINTKIPHQEESKPPFS